MDDEREEDERRIGALASRPPGYDTEDPYADVDLADLPEWWRDVVEEFRTYDMRPYRPPRFEDGVLKHEVVDDLEEQLDVDVMIRTTGGGTGEWTVFVDGEPAREIGHRRTTEGFTVFEMASGELRALVREHTSDRGSR